MRRSRIPRLHHLRESIAGDVSGTAKVYFIVLHENISGRLRHMQLLIDVVGARAAIGDLAVQNPRESIKWRHAIRFDDDEGVCSICEKLGALTAYSDCDKLASSSTSPAAR